MLLMYAMLLFIRCKKLKLMFLKLNKVTVVVKGNDEIYYVTVKDANGVTDSFGCVNLVFATGE